MHRHLTVVGILALALAWAGCKGSGEGGGEPAEKSLHEQLQTTWQDESGRVELTFTASEVRIAMGDLDGESGRYTVVGTEGDQLTIELELMGRKTTLLLTVAGDVLTTQEKGKERKETFRRKGAAPAAAGSSGALEDYTARAKTTEAIDQLDKIYKGAAIYFATPKIDRTGRKLMCQFPADQPPTPVEGTCCGSRGGPDADNDNRCDAAWNHWDSDTWSALSFQITDQHYFVYAFDSNGLTGPEAQFTASAYGDLDCDGVMSTFQRMGFGDPGSTMAECSLQGSAAFYVEQETE